MHAGTYYGIQKNGSHNIIEDSIDVPFCFMRNLTLENYIILTKAL